MEIQGIEVPDLSEKLQRLTVPQQIAFSASCSERLFPNYQAFFKEENWGDPDVMRVALDTVWDNLEEGVVPSKGLSELIEECDSVTPDTEDFETPLVSSALDAGTAIVGTLELCKDGDWNHAFEAAGFARDTVYLALSAQGLDDVDMVQHPWMKRELEKQEEDLTVLASSPTLSTALVLQLRHSWKNQNGGLSNIDL